MEVWKYSRRKRKETGMGTYIHLRKANVYMGFLRRGCWRGAIAMCFTRMGRSTKDPSTAKTRRRAVVSLKPHTSLTLGASRAASSTGRACRYRIGTRGGVHSQTDNL